MMLKRLLLVRRLFAYTFQPYFIISEFRGAIVYSYVWPSSKRASYFSEASAEPEKLPDNRALVDDNQAQTLSAEEITRLKQEVRTI
jgi:hypothetical protein